MRRQIGPWLILIGLVMAGPVQAQQWGVSIQMNELYTLRNDLKGDFPALWYSSTEGRGVLLGGFGAGAYWQQPLSSSFRWRAQAGVSRTRYYDVPVVFRDENGQLLGAFFGTATQLNTTLCGLVEYDLFSWMHVAAGAGVQVTPWGMTDYGEAIVQGEKTSLKFRDRSRQPVVGLLPVELSFSLGKHLRIRERIEWSISPVSKRADQKDERFLINYLEFAYTFGRPADP